MANTTSRLRSLPAALLTCLTLSVAVALPAFAVNDFNDFNGPSDPFATRSLTPPPPALALVGASAQRPCQPLPGATVYGVLEVVEQALCGNPTTREAWSQARFQAAGVGLAQSEFLPTLDGLYSIDRVKADSRTATQHNASLTLSWLLFDFGARSANLEVARQLLSAATATLDASVQSVFLGALQAYYNVQAARAAVTAALESEKASRESLSAAEVRYRVGTGTPADRLQAQTAWSQATLNRIRAEGLLQSTRGRLANVMGLDANQPLQLDDIPAAWPDPPGPGFEREVAALIDQARAQRPDLKAAQAQLKAALAGIDLARAAGLPTLSLGAGPTWERLGGVSADASSFGLTLKLPIFSAFSTTYNVRSAQAQSEVQAARLDNVRLQVALEVWEAYQSLTTATQTIRTTADLLASAEQSERVALGRYKAGVGNILDVLNAQSALASARLQQVQARLDWQVSRATLARAIGALNGELLASMAGKARTP